MILRATSAIKAIDWIVYIKARCVKAAQLCSHEVTHRQQPYHWIVVPTWWGCWYCCYYQCRLHGRKLPLLFLSFPVESSRSSVKSCIIPIYYVHRRYECSGFLARSCSRLHLYIRPFLPALAFSRFLETLSFFFLSVDVLWALAIYTSHAAVNANVAGHSE